jgi:outer membrane protein assembly factor BamD
MKHIVRFCALVLALGFVLNLAAGCHKKIPPVKPPEQLYNEGLLYMSKGKGGNFVNPPDYEKARELFESVIYEYPTSRYAPLAELRIADTYYEAGEYTTAADEYAQWRKHHVGRPEIPYVIYRVGMAYYHLILSQDRDQTCTHKALDNFQYLVANYPENEYTKAIGEKMSILEVRLARHEMYVGRFYFRHERWWSAVDRFQVVMENYPRKGFDEEALYYTWRSYRKLDRFDESAETFHKMVENYPNGQWTRRARLLEREEKGKGAKSWLK